MTISTEDCKEFIATHAREKNIPSDNWKRVSKKKNNDGVLRVFKHPDGYEVSILEDANHVLQWANTISLANNHIVQRDALIDKVDESFSTLPTNVKVFVNTLRSLQGQDILEKSSFHSQYVRLWESNIADRQAHKEQDIPTIMMFDSDGCDDSFDILRKNFDLSFDNQDVIKYMSQYFWFCFANDPREDNKLPQLFISPKGFIDDWRIPLIFDGSKLTNTSLVEHLSEVADSTLEFDTNTSDPESRIKEAYIAMQNIGIEFSKALQQKQKIVTEYKELDIYYKDKIHDFCNDVWLSQHLGIAEPIKYEKPLRYEVYFQYGETEEQRDFLKSFPTLKEARDYRKSQIKNEGWEGNDPTYMSYAEQYKIVDSEKELKKQKKNTI